MRTPLPFKPLKKMRLYEEVADQIKQSIYDGQLSTGDPLPPERELCRIFDVGRPTIREALRTLSVMGLVDVQTGKRGAVVKNCDLTHYMEAMREQLSQIIRVEEKTASDLLEVRKYIDLGIAHSAAKNATKNDFKRLGTFIKKMEACKDDFQMYFPIAVEFHEELALVTRNKIFYMIWKIFQDILLKGYPPHLDELFPKGLTKLLEANKLMLEAIQSKDPDKIHQAMEIHAAAEQISSEDSLFKIGKQIDK